jgi:hypothetical protein
MEKTQLSTSFVHEETWESSTLNSGARNHAAKDTGAA